MIRRLIAISAVITLVSTFGLSAYAQSFGNSSRGSSGLGGMGSGGFGGGMGSSGFGGGMGSSGFGGGMGSSGFGGSGMSSGFGSSGFGNSGFGGGGNSMFGNSGVGNSSGYGGSQPFIGRDPGDMQSTFNQMGRAGTQFFNSMNRNMRNNSRRSTKQTVRNPAQPTRVDVKVAFTSPRPTADQMALDVRTRLAKLLTANRMSQPTVDFEGDTVVLRGTAASENERDVISQLMAIEPGIRNVRNEMTVGLPAGAANDISPSPGS